MSYYREKLLEALRVLVDDGDLNMRLTHAAGCLIQIDDDDVPLGAFAEFERIRDPLIQQPMISKGEMLPRAFPTADARAAAHGIVGLVAAELGMHSRRSLPPSTASATPDRSSDA